MKIVLSIIAVALCSCAGPQTQYLPGINVSGYGVNVSIPPSVIPASGAAQTVNVPVTVPASNTPTVVTASAIAAPVAAPVAK